MAGERRGGLEITSSKAAPSGPAVARPPGDVLFDLVFSNESLWSTVDPHAAKGLVERSIQSKGVVDIGDVLRELLDRKTKPDLARGLVLAFSMELARMSVAIRLPAELQSLDRTSRQKLVDVFRSGQKTSDEPTQTLAYPSPNSGPGRPSPARPPPQRTASGTAPPQPAARTTPPRTTTPPARATTPPTQANDDALAGWGQGLGAVTDAKGKGGRAPEVSGANRAARGPAEQTRERSRTAIEKPRRDAAVDFSSVATPGRLIVLGVSIVLFVVGVLLGPRAPRLKVGDPLAGELPCLRVEENETHGFCVVDLEQLPPRMTADDFTARKAAMLASARARGLVTLTFVNPDLTRFEPTLVPARIVPELPERRSTDDDAATPTARRSSIEFPDEQGEEEEPVAEPQEPYIPREERLDPEDGKK